jgi:hypothetical protein
MKFRSFATALPLFILLTSCVTTLSPPLSTASPQQTTASATTTDTVPKTQAVKLGSGTIRPVYLLGIPPAGKGSPGSASPGQMRQAIAKIASKKPKPDDKKIFASYRGNGSQRANNWMRNFDFSGVSWDSARTATLISDRHVIMAGHYDRPKGASITFHDRNGRPVVRTLAAVKRAPPGPGGSPYPDVTVGRLNQPVPNTLTFYPVLPSSNYSKLLLHQDMLITTSKREVFRFNILSAYHSAAIDIIRSGNSVKLDLDRAWGGALVAGDSGNPGFVAVNGKLVFVCTNTFGGQGSNGPFYGGPVVQGFVLNAINDLEKQFN